MHFNEFLQLNETEQVELLWYNGEQIGRRKENDYLILLYQVEEFYVEVFYHRKERVIKKYLSFDCADKRLDSYLEKIDIAHIYKQIRKPSRIAEPGLMNYFVNLTTERPSEEKLQPPNRIGFWKKLLSLFRRSH